MSNPDPKVVWVQCPQCKQEWDYDLMEAITNEADGMAIIVCPECAEDYKMPEVHDDL